MKIHYYDKLENDLKQSAIQFAEKTVKEVIKQDGLAVYRSAYDMEEPSKDDLIKRVFLNSLKQYKKVLNEYIIRYSVIHLNELVFENVIDDIKQST